MTMTLTPSPATLENDRPTVRASFEAPSGRIFVTLQVRRDGRPVRAKAPTGADVSFVDDYEAPFGKTIAYTATGTTALASDPEGATQPYSAMGTTQLNETAAWLIHPTYPSLSVRIDRGRWVDEALNVSVASAQDVARATSQAVFQPNGRSRSVVFPLGPRKDGTWTLELITFSLSARDSVVDLLADNVPVALRSPEGWPWDLPDDWYAVGDISVDRVVAPLDDPGRSITLPLVPVASPPVTLAPSMTWDDLLADGTWSAVLDKYESWFNVLTGEVE